MKAIRLERPGVFAPIELEEPAPPGPGEALVAIRRVGVCGTDFAGYRGTMPFIECPRILGHELAGEILKVGEGVTHLRAGDRCSVEPYLNCGACFACERGTVNCCQRLEVLGVHIDGGLRLRINLPARKLHPSRKLEPDQLALVEPLGIGFHAVNRGAPRRGDDALVIGAGPIGLATLEFLRLAGARATVVDVNEGRLDLCRRKGAARTATSPGDALFPLVIDATGNAASMGNALNSVAHGGTLVFVGITREKVAIDDPVLHRREITVRASRNALPDEFDRIIRLMEEGKVDSRPWITHRTAFDRFIDDFPAYTRPETGVIKAVVDV